MSITAWKGEKDELVTGVLAISQIIWCSISWIRENT